MYSEEEIYHRMILEYKRLSVSTQNYEVVVVLRNIETTYFKVTGNKFTSGRIERNLKMGTGDASTFSNYIGFNKELFIKDLMKVSNTNGGEWIVRDFQLKNIGI